MFNRVSPIRLLRNSITLSLENLSSTTANEILIDSKCKIVVDPISLTPLRYSQTTDDLFVIDSIATPEEFNDCYIKLDQPNFDIDQFIAADPSRFLLSSSIHSRHAELLEPIKHNLNGLSSVWSGSAGSYIALYDLFSSIDYATYPQLSIDDQDLIKTLVSNAYQQLQSNQKAAKVLNFELDDVDTLFNDSSVDTEKLINRICFALNMADIPVVATQINAIFNRHISVWLLNSINNDRDIVSKTISEQLSPILFRKKLTSLQS